MRSRMAIRLLVLTAGFTFALVASATAGPLTRSPLQVPIIE
jgi:hypothetical protein